MKVLDKLLKLFLQQKDKVLLFSYSTQVSDVRVFFFSILYYLTIFFHIPIVLWCFLREYALECSVHGCGEIVHRLNYSWSQKLIHDTLWPTSDIIITVAVDLVHPFKINF